MATATSITSIPTLAPKSPKKKTSMSNKATPMSSGAVPISTPGREDKSQSENLQLDVDFFVKVPLKVKSISYGAPKTGTVGPAPAVPFRVGIEEDAITRIDPLSLAFESSIRWENLSGSSTILERRSPTELLSFNIDNLSAVSRLSVVDMRSYHFSEEIMEIPSSTSNVDLGIRKENRKSERFFALRNCTCAIPSSAGITPSLVKAHYCKLIKNSIMGWAYSDAVFSFSGTIRSPDGRKGRNYLGYVSEAYPWVNRLINVYEAKKGSLYCLSFIQFWRGEGARGVADKTSEPVLFHVWVDWYRMWSSSAPSGTNLGSQNVLAPVYEEGGIKHLLTRLLLANIGVSIEGDNAFMSVNNDGAISKVEITSRELRYILNNPYLYGFSTSCYGVSTTTGSDIYLHELFKIREGKFNPLNPPVLKNLLEKLPPGKPISDTGRPDFVLQVPELATMLPAKVRQKIASNYVLEEMGKNAGGIPAKNCKLTDLNCLPFKL